MSQYYPPQGPMYPPPPPPQNPESDYYDEGDYEYEEYEESSGGPLTNPWVAFFGGGCLVFLCMSICILMAAILWIADSSMGLTSPAPIPGSDIGLTFDAPAFPGESVVNDDGVQLTVLEVNRNAAVEGILPVEGREVIIVTVELVNLGSEDAAFNERDFTLLNAYEEAYAPTVGIIAGALGRGTLPPNEGLEGRLVFETIAGEIDMRVRWESGQQASPRFLYLE
jgi:hypothetical protein